MNPIGTELWNRVGRINSVRASMAPGTIRGILHQVLVMADEIGNGAKAQRENPMIPVEGRRKVLQDAVPGHLRRLAELKTKVDAQIATLRSERAGRHRLPAPPSDPASIQVRSEIRAMLRSMDSKSRTAALDLNNLDPVTLAAILEAPAALSGTVEPVLNRIRGALAAAKGIPDFDEDDAEMERLADAALRVAQMAITEASEMSPVAVEQMAANIRAESHTAVDHSEAPLGDLLAAAREAA